MAIAASTWRGRPAFNAMSFSGRAFNASLFSALLLILSLAIGIQLHSVGLQPGDIALASGGIFKREAVAVSVPEEDLAVNKSSIEVRVPGIYKRALDQGLVCRGQQLIKDLNDKNYAASQWTLTTSLNDNGWAVSDLTDPERMNEGAAVLQTLNPAVDTTVANWIQKRTANSVPYQGTGGTVNVSPTAKPSHS
jgi:hypothetical protein